MDSTLVFGKHCPRMQNLAKEVEKITFFENLKKVAIFKINKSTNEHLKTTKIESKIFPLQKELYFKSFINLNLN